MMIFSFFSSLCYGIDPSGIIEKSDKKFIPDIFTYHMTLRTTSADGKIDVVEYKGKKKFMNNIMITLIPLSAKGQVNLKNRNVIWSYFPTSDSSVKQSYQAIILGTTVSYGDILALELSRDYNVESMMEISNLIQISSNYATNNTRTVPIGTNSYYLLTLIPKKGIDGYARGLIWINKGNLLPVKREYYAYSGLLVKSCEIKSISFDENGVVTDSEELFYEPLKKKQTLVTFSNIKILKDIPDTTFNPRSMKFFSGE
jgi:outer membrane lipoprotein-sorting protein